MVVLARLLLRACMRTYVRVCVCVCMCVTGAKIGLAMFVKRDKDPILW